jgi:hypothetical protein
LADNFYLLGKDFLEVWFQYIFCNDQQEKPEQGASAPQTGPANPVWCFLSRRKMPLHLG